MAVRPAWRRPRPRGWRSLKGTRSAKRRSQRGFRLTIVDLGVSYLSLRRAAPAYPRCRLSRPSSLSWPHPPVRTVPTRSQPRGEGCVVGGNSTPELMHCRGCLSSAWGRAAQTKRPGLIESGTLRFEADRRLRSSGRAGKPHKRDFRYRRTRSRSLWWRP